MRDQDQDKSILIFLLLFLTRLALIVARPVRGLHSWEFSKENSRGCVSVLISYSLLFGIYYDLSGPNTFVCLEPRFIYIKKKVIIKIYKKRKEKGKEENDHQGQLPDTIIHPKKKKKKRKSVIEVRHGSIYPGKKKKKLSRSMTRRSYSSLGSEMKTVHTSLPSKLYSVLLLCYSIKRDKWSILLTNQTT